MARITALATATKLQLAAGTLLLIDLFLTWQNAEIDYGGTHVTSALDGWNLAGGLLGLLTLGLLALVILRAADFELSPEVPWAKITLVLGIAIFVVALGKNLLESGSTWASYLGVFLAAVVAYASYKDWSQTKDLVVSDEDAEPVGPWGETPRQTRARAAAERRHRQTQRW